MQFKIFSKGSFLFVLTLISTLISYSQGGTNGTAAAGAPITLPFSANGTTIGRGNDYSNISVMGDPGFTSGPDWLYYFCATSDNLLTYNLTFTADAINGVWPSISVWRGGVPGVGTLVEENATDGTTTSSLTGQIIIQTGQCYYILIDNWTLPDGFPYNLALTLPPAEPILPVQPSCTNIGFDNGNFTGWTGGYSYSVTTNLPGTATPLFVPETYLTNTVQHAITSGAATDPIAGFPQVCPGLGPNSARLGSVDVIPPDNLYPGRGGAMLEQKFAVTNSNALFTYNYAAVIQNALAPFAITNASGGDSTDITGNIVYVQNAAGTGDSLAPHLATQQPFFKVELFDNNNNPLSCGNYLVVGGPGVPGFTLAPGSTDIYYRDWTAAFIDLTPYIGSNVKVRFSVADCSLGGHFSYVYLDGICEPLIVNNPVSVCPNGSTTLTSSLTGISYSWTNDAAPSVVLGTAQSLNVTPTAASTTYKCVVTAPSGCSTTLTFTVNVYPTVIATATKTTVCAGSPGTITTTVNPTGGSFTWTNGGSSNTFTLSPAATTTYTGTYTDLNGCTDTAVAVITVNPLPVAPPTTPVTYCQNQTPNSLTSSVTVSSGCTLNWYTASSGGSPIPLPIVSTASASTITYYVSQTITATGCEGPRSPITVTVNPLPVVTVNSPSTCAGIAVTLSASGANTYSWSTNPVQTGASISVTPLVPTSYTVTGTSTLNCSNSATSNVSINGTLALSVNSETICEGSSTVITAVGATDYVWASGETTASISVSPTTTTTYSVTGTTAGCVGTVTSSVTVNPVPTVTVNSPTVCNGTAASITATPNLTGGTYAWSPTSLTTSTISVTPSATTPYTVTYTLNGCQNTGTGTVTVNPIPTVTVNSQAICAGDPPATLTATPSPTGGTYLWNPSSTTASTISMSPTSTTPYTVTYTLNGCSATGSGTITVNPLPVIDAGGSRSVCIGSSVTLTATGASSYVWDNNVVNGVAFIPSGTDTYTVTGMSSAGCIASDNVTITIIPLPVVSFYPSDTFGCAPLNVIFTNTTNGGATNCVWTFGDGSTSSGCSTVQHSFNTAGCYDITLTTSTPEGCSNTLTLPSLICVEARPIADFVPSPTVMPNYSTLSTMYNQSSAAVAYSWNFNDGSGSTETNPSHLFPGVEEADYLITLVAYSQSGCTDTARVPVHVYEEVIYYVPNTFTPDGDDFNEVFLPVFSSGFDPSDYTLYIFNRWGDLIFESHDPKVGWKGTFGADGNLVQDDTYTWKIIYKHKNDKKKNVVVGHVNVLK
jgi:gliding motility-associated-like protein